MNEGEDMEVLIIPVAQIRVANPRVRDKRKFELVVQSIAAVGLKRPITVMEGPPAADGSPAYDLVCGQGRLEAFIALGQTEIPAFVRKMTKPEGLIASLVENIARRRMSAIDQMQTIRWMKDQGNSIESIAQKTGLSESYTQGILKLLEQGEERVLDPEVAAQFGLELAARRPVAAGKGRSERLEKTGLVAGVEIGSGQRNHGVSRQLNRCCTRRRSPRARKSA